MTVKQFLRSIGAEHARPELITMHECFAEDAGIRDTDLEDLCFATWDKCATALWRAWGVQPHVALVAQKARVMDEAF